jgi:hypothetical protein
MITDKQKQAIEAYNTLMELGVETSLEFNSNGTLEIKVWNTKELTKIKNIVREAGIVINKLEKHGLQNNTSQYADGWTNDNKIELVVFASGLFNGCKTVETKELITIPATEEHQETIVHRKIVCGKEAE